MKEELQRIEERLDSIEKVLVKQEEQLKYHIRRTEIAEENLNMLRKDFGPVKSHVTFVNNICKFIVACGGILLFLEQTGLLKKILQIFG